MDRKTKVFAWIALVLGALCLLMVTVWIGLILPNVSFSEYSVLAISVLFAAVINVFAGSVLAVLSLVSGCLALVFANRSHGTPPRRCSVFSIIGIAGAGLLLLCNLLFLILK